MGEGSLANAVDIVVCKLRGITGYANTSPVFAPLNAAVTDLERVLLLVETCASETKLRAAKKGALVMSAGGQGETPTATQRCTLNCCSIGSATGLARQYKMNTRRVIKARYRTGNAGQADTKEKPVGIGAQESIFARKRSKVGR